MIDVAQGQKPHAAGGEPPGAAETPRWHQLPVPGYVERFAVGFQGGPQARSALESAQYSYFQSCREHGILPKMPNFLVVEPALSKAGSATGIAPGVVTAQPG